jgi:hypothetical protein
MPFLPDDRSPALDLQGFLSPFGGLLRRAESRRALEAYVAGLTAPLERKTAADIARAVSSASSQSLQEFLTRTTWEERDLNAMRIAGLLQHASVPPGVLVLDEVRLPKTGEGAVGSARQCPGARGARLLCQRLVLAHYGDDTFEWPTGFRLYLPKEWTDAPERREASRIPAAVEYQSMGDLAAALVRDAQGARIPLHAVVLGEQLAARPEAFAALAEIERSRVAVAAVVQRLDGFCADDDRVLPSDPARLAAELAPSQWRTVAHRGRSGAPQVRRVARLRVRLAEPGWGDGGAQWLLLVRPPNESGVTTHFVSGARGASLDDLAALVQHHDLVRRFEQSASRDLGFADYEGRLWSGLHRHIALVMLAHSYRLITDAYGSGAA